MSAYVVRDKVVNNIANFFFFKSNYPGEYGLLVYKTKNAGYDLGNSNINEAARLGQDLFDLNCKAIDDKDGPGGAARFRPLDYKFVRNMPRNRFTVLKCIEEFLYQCSEGGPVMDSELFKLVQAAANEIRRVIVDDMAEYKAAATI